MFLLPPAFALGDGLINGWGHDPGALPLVIFGIPMAIVGSIYLGSGLYGLHVQSRCERMKDEEAEAFTFTPRPGAVGSRREPVVGDAPMHCAITEPDVGACFVMETECSEEVARSGGTCETRNQTWCFDVRTLVSNRPETTCAASAVDCDARRVAFASDRTLQVTACGTYAVRGEPGLPDVRQH